MVSSSSVTVSWLLPRLEMVEVTESVAPLTRLTSTTRAMTPMMMPSMVRIERILLAPMDRRAIFRDNITASPP